MSEQRKQELLEATQHALALARARPLAERIADLKNIGILDDDGVLSSRYGGPGQMTWPSDQETRPE